MRRSVLRSCSFCMLLFAKVGNLTHQAMVTITVGVVRSRNTANFARLFYSQKEYFE